MNEQWYDRLHAICVALTGRTKADNVHQVAELFNLNNEAAKELKFPLEYSKHCAACVQRVNKRLRAYWESNVKERYENKIQE